MLSFPHDVVPVSGQLQHAGYFIPDNSNRTANIIDPLHNDELPWLCQMPHNFIGTDGSTTNDHGTYAFVILIHLHQAEPTIAVKCSGNMPDLAKFLDMDSHEPESAALLAALCFIRKLLHHFPWGPPHRSATQPMILPG